MAWTPGDIPISANFQNSTAKPLEPKSLALNISDRNSIPFKYKGMVTTVTDDPTPSNNGVYVLETLPGDLNSHWEKVGQTAITAYNGLTLVSGNSIKLGGTLSGYTVIYGASNYLDFIDLADFYVELSNAFTVNTTDYKLEISQNRASFTDKKAIGAQSGITYTAAYDKDAGATGLTLVTKSYVDGLTQGLSFKEAVRVVSTSNITLSGLQTIDGVLLVDGDRVLVNGQTTASENGYYSASAGAWSRTTDADTSAEVKSGMFTFVTEGTTYQDTGWVLSTDETIVLDTTDLTFVQFSSADNIEAGDGLNKTGDTLSLDLDTNSGLSLTGSGLAIATGSAGSLLNFTNGAYNLGGTATQATTLTLAGFAFNIAGGAVSLNGLTYPSADGTTDQFLKTDGAGNLTFADIPAVYTHPSFTVRNISVDSTTLTGADVIESFSIDFTSNNEGHVTNAVSSLTTRTLTPADIGAQPAGIYDNYASWNVQASGTLGTYPINSNDTLTISAGTGVSVTRSGANIVITNTEPGSGNVNYNQVGVNLTANTARLIQHDLNSSLVVASFKDSSTGEYITNIEIDYVTDNSINITSFVNRVVDVTLLAAGSNNAPVSGGGIELDSTSITSSQILNSNSTPVTLLAAGQPNTSYHIQHIRVKVTGGTTDYATNTVLLVQFSSGEVISSINLADLPASGRWSVFNIGSHYLIPDEAVVVTARDGNPTTGDKTINVELKYEIVE